MTLCAHDFAPCLLLLRPGSAQIVNIESVAQTSLLIFNAVTTLIVAILFSLSSSLYEVPAHYIEYSAQIPMALVDVIFVLQSFRAAPSARSNDESHDALRATEDEHHADISSVVDDNDQPKDVVGRVIVVVAEQQQRSVGMFQYIQGVVAIAAGSNRFSYVCVDLTAHDEFPLCSIVIASVAQLLIYAEVIPVSIEPERASHFVEFITEAVNGVFAVWYGMILLTRVERELDNVGKQLVDI